MGQQSINKWGTIVCTVILVLVLLGLFGSRRAASPDPDGFDGYRTNGRVCISDYQPGDTPLYLEGKALPPCATTVPAR